MILQEQQQITQVVEEAVGMDLEDPLLHVVLVDKAVRIQVEEMLGVQSTLVEVVAELVQQTVHSQADQEL